MRRKRPQLPRRWQRRQQRLGVVHLHTLTPDARGEVQVEAPLEAVLQRVIVARHMAQRRILGGQERQLAVLGVGGLPLGALVVAQQVLLRRVVRLDMRRQRQLGCRHMHRVISPRLVGIAPYRIEARLLAPRRMRHNAALPNRTHNLHNLLVLPFARHEAALGLRARRQRHRALVLRKPVRRRLVHVIVAQRHLGALHPPDHIELLVRQLDIHPALLISGREPRIAALALDALEKLVELIALRWTQHTPPIDIVANMRQVVVPRHRHLAYAVRHVLRTRITVILRLNRRIHRLELARSIRAHHAPTL